MKSIHVQNLGLVLEFLIFETQSGIKYDCGIGGLPYSMTLETSHGLAMTVTRCSATPNPRTCHVATSLTRMIDG